MQAISRLLIHRTTRHRRHIPNDAQTVKTVRSYTLCQLEDRFSSCLPQTLFPKAAAHTSSRDRLYTRWLTLWSMLWQGFKPQGLRPRSSPANPGPP